MAEESKLNLPDEPPDKVTFHYIKSNYFRVVHSDGVIGGPGPSGDSVRLSFYSDRVPLPLQVEMKVSAEGMPVETLSQVGRSGIVREVDAEVVMSLDVAKQVAEFILKQIQITEEVKAHFKALAEKKAKEESK